MSRLHFYKRTQVFGQNSALASARGGKLGVEECVLGGAMKQFISKCLMGPQEIPMGHKNAAIPLPPWTKPKCKSLSSSKYYSMLFQ